MEALIAGFDMHYHMSLELSQGEGVGGGGGGGETEKTVLTVKGNGFVTEEEEAFHARNLLTLGQDSPAYTRGYNCSLCFTSSRR